MRVPLSQGSHAQRDGEGASGSGEGAGEVVEPNGEGIRRVCCFTVPHGDPPGFCVGLAGLDQPLAGPERPTVVEVLELQPPGTGRLSSQGAINPL